ncbi:hypothetical protein QN277_029448 [Acacia crassicarpa]|uniref:Uncharacterized protein n=1 Tax=Acacia crassicarpa TaxID=499986 RepID=A0AAE1MG75_9FABA|nr:hypothetical protein QN277_029448 [Acacia crassicarpa]
MFGGLHLRRLNFRFSPHLRFIIQGFGGLVTDCHMRRFKPISFTYFHLYAISIYLCCCVTTVYRAACYVLYCEWLNFSARRVTNFYLMARN